MATVQIPISLDTPDSTGNAYPGLSVATAFGFSNVRRLAPAFTKSVDSFWSGTIRVPQDYVGSGTVICSFVANATSGAIRVLVSTKVVANLASEDAAYTDETAQNVTVPATANQRKDISFTLTTTPVAGSSLNVKVTRNGANAADTLAVDALLWECVFQYANS